MLVPIVVAAALASAPGPSAANPPSKPDETPETKISIDVKDAHIVDVVRLLAEVGQFQLVIDPGVQCQVTLKLTEVYWTTALDVALRSCQLGRDDDQGIVRVAPVARLTQEAQARRQLEEQKRLAAPVKVTRYRLSYAKARELAPVIKKFLSARGEVVVDERTNTLIVIDVD
jgi:type IV pilus assembly protein PilQ